jgi:hypothetical protein
MKLLVSVLGCFADYGFACKRRWRCLRTGHTLLCTVDGHLCTRCGRNIAASTDLPARREATRCPSSPT